MSKHISSHFVIIFSIFISIAITITLFVTIGMYFYIDDIDFIPFFFGIYAIIYYAKKEKKLSKINYMQSIIISINKYGIISLCLSIAFSIFMIANNDSFDEIDPRRHKLIYDLMLVILFLLLIIIAFAFHIRNSGYELKSSLIISFFGMISLHWWILLMVVLSIIFGVLW